MMVCTTTVHVCALKYNHLQEDAIYSELAECAEMQHASYVNRAGGHARALIVTVRVCGWGYSRGR